MSTSYRSGEETIVADLYENSEVAETYITHRFVSAWGKLLHKKQVRAINTLIEETKPKTILEIAPGPARLATELKGVGHGLMIDNSTAMLAVAQRRLQAAGVSHFWQLQKRNAFELDTLGKRFHFVFTFRFIRHFRQDERARLYRSIDTCLEPEGLLMFDVVNKTMRDSLDARQPQKLTGELDVYDETYSAASFHSEMKEYGFNVIHLTPVLHNFFLQSWISHRLGYRLPKASSALVRWLETMPSQEPLEWIALCQKISPTKG
jgi:ubiquinone/menaquinone biosynthesis C-methylase UbiE